MNFAKLYCRCRWLHGPVGLLVVLLQRTPVLRVLSQAEYFFENAGGTVLKSAFGLAALGAYNSVAGATTFQVAPATPSSGPVNQQFAISGTVGTAMSDRAKEARSAAVEADAYDSISALTTAQTALQQAVAIAAKLPLPGLAQKA